MAFLKTFRLGYNADCFLFAGWLVSDYAASGLYQPELGYCIDPMIHLLLNKSPQVQAFDWAPEPGCGAVRMIYPLKDELRHVQASDLIPEPACCFELITHLLGNELARSEALVEDPSIVAVLSQWYALTDRGAWSFMHSGAWILMKKSFCHRCLSVCMSVQ